MKKAIIYRFELAYGHPYTERTLILPPSITTGEMADYIHAAFGFDPGHGAFIDNGVDFSVDDIGQSHFAGYFDTSLRSDNAELIYHPQSGCWQVYITQLATRQNYHGAVPVLVDALGPDILASAHNIQVQTALLELVRMQLSGLELDAQQAMIYHNYLGPLAPPAAFARLTQADEPAITERLLGVELSESSITTTEPTAEPDNNVISLSQLQAFSQIRSHSGTMPLSTRDEIRLGLGVFFQHHLRFFRKPVSIAQDGTFDGDIVDDFRAFHQSYPLLGIHSSPVDFDATYLQALTDFYFSLEALRHNTADGTVALTTRGVDLIGCTECALAIMLKALPLHSSKGQRKQLRRALATCLVNAAEGRALIDAIDRNGGTSNGVLFDALGVFTFDTDDTTVTGLSKHGGVLIEEILDKVGAPVTAL